MELSQETLIDITTFINPHLFWVVIKNEERGKCLAHLNKEMEKSIQNKEFNKSTFEIGQIVAAQIGDKLYRGIIEDVVYENIANNLYLLWLIDYGTMRETVNVFKLPISVRKTPPLALQASLNNVVYNEQVLEYDSNGQLKTVTKHVIHPSPMSLEKSTLLLSSGHNLKFKLEKKEDGIMFGDVLYKDKDNNDKSLRDCLIQAGIVDTDIKLSADIAHFITTYRENHLMVVSKICNKEPYPLEDNSNKEVTTSCMTIVSKILDEFEYNDLLSFEDEAYERYWHLNRCKNESATSLETTSDNESSDKSKSKKTRLMEKLWEHKNSSKTNQNGVLSDSTKDTISERQPSSSKHSKIKKLCEKMKQQKMSKASETKNPRLNGRNVIFSPAGSERTFVPANRSLSQSNEFLRNENVSSSKICHSTFKKSTEDVSSNKKVFQETCENKTTSSNENLFQTKTADETISDDNGKQSSVDESSPSTEPNCTNLPPIKTLKIKPHCSCKQCTVWTKEENVFIENLGNRPKVAKLEGVKPQLLFKENENAEFKVDICAIDYTSMNKIEKQAAQKLLVHSEIISNPIGHVYKMAFHKAIHHNLHQLGYKEAKRIQSYAWPAVFRNQHVFMINGPQTGKTIAYLPVMLTFLLEKYDRYASLVKVAGAPIVIILCGNTHKCEEVYDVAKIILRNLKVNMSLVTYPLRHINTSHTDMLISTPDILVDLLKKKNVNFKRLCHLIIEDGDTVLTKQNNTMKAIFELAQSMLKHRVFTKTLQLIVCAEHWNSQIKYLMKNLQQVPMVCVGNYLEACIYGQVEFSMKFMISPCKDLELIHLLKETHRVYRSAIICKEDEIAQIKEILSLKGIDNIAISSEMSQEDILHLEDVWTYAKGGTYAVLICSDFILHTLFSVTCAHILIHYSLPKSWTKFIKRFGCLLENCRSPLDSKQHKIVSKSVVLCDEICKDQMYKFFNYINSTELKKQLPENLQEFSKNLRAAEEEHKLGKRIGLCGYIKLYGKCIRSQCDQRHSVNSNLDISDYLPHLGKVKFKIVNITDVAIYSIQLLQHVDSENKVHEFDEISDLTEDLTATLRLSRKKIQNPVLGHHYAFYNYDEQDGMYYRCEVVDIEGDCVRIKLLDRGSIVTTLTTRLYRMPREFGCDIKPRAIIDAYLANCIPPYKDENFSAKSFFNLKTLLESHDYKNIIFTGEIHLQLGHTLWLKDVHQEIVLSDKIIRGLQLSREILLKNLVENDPSQLNNLYNLCTEAGVVLPEYTKKSKTAFVKKHEVHIQWAYLDTEQVNEVTFAAAFSPEEVYVRLNKYSGLLYNLQKEIQQSLTKPNYPKLREVQVGGIYLAIDPDGLEYCRVLVLKQELDKALCFYVDFADEIVIPVCDLKYIDDYFITKLPFQCIHCRLYGIKPSNNEWDDNIVNTLYGYAHEPNTDIFRSLFVKVCKKERNSSGTPTTYSVLVKDGFGAKNVLINQLLIECGMAITNSEDNFSDFEIPSLQHDAPDSDEELADVAYICKKTDELDQCFGENGVPQAENNNVEDNYDEMDLFLFGDPIDFYIQLATGKEPSSTNKTNELPALTAAPKVEYFTPEVYWSQTENTVKLSIRLTDVQDYKLTVTKGRMFNFRTIKDERTYSLKWMFYEHVDTLQHTSTGPEVRVTVTKTKCIDWPRLILSKHKVRNIHYDMTKLASRDEEEHQRFLQLPKELDEDSEELNEDDPMYTVYSDLDSDMDEEIPHDLN